MTFSWPVMLWAAAFCGFIGVWTIVAVRLALGQPVLPYQPRRPVPWRAIDIAVVVIAYVMIQTAVLSLAHVFLDPDVLQPPTMYNLDEISTVHILTRLISENNVWILGLCALAAVVIAPITEEFLFRLLLQGGLESAQRRWRRRSRPIWKAKLKMCACPTGWSTARSAWWRAPAGRTSGWRKFCASRRAKARRCCGCLRSTSP